jgi:hypothetical protein
MRNIPRHFNNLETTHLKSLYQLVCWLIMDYYQKWRRFCVGGYYQQNLNYLETCITSNRVWI